MLVGVEQVDRGQPLRRVAGHGDEYAPESVDEGVDVGPVEHIGVELDAKAQFVSRHRLDGQRIVVVLAVADAGDRQAVATGQSGEVQRVVLVDEQGVEDLVLAGDPVDLAEREVLVVEGLGVGVLQLRDQVGESGCGRGTCPHRHGVDQQADHRVGTEDLDRSARHRSAERDVMVAGQRHQRVHPGGLEHCADCGVVRAGQLAEGPRGVLADLERCDVPRPLAGAAGRADQGGCLESGQYLTPGRAGCLEIPAGQPGDEPAVRRGGRQPLAVVTSEDLLQHDGQ